MVKIHFLHSLGQVCGQENGTGTIDKMTMILDEVDVEVGGAADVVEAAGIAKRSEKWEWPTRSRKQEWPMK